MRVRSTGKELSAEWVQIYTLKDGKICDFREFYDTAQEVEGYRRTSRAN
jgi:ketosteroid isomerase-like protein